jgi:YD repeat-containing protein
MPGRAIGEAHTPGKTRFVWDGLRLRQAITEDALGTRSASGSSAPRGGRGNTPVAAID